MEPLVAAIAQRQRGVQISLGALGKRTAFLTCFIQMLTAHSGSMAERSKAPGLGPGPHLWAWVRTPLLSSPNSHSSVGLEHQPNKLGVAGSSPAVSIVIHLLLSYSFPIISLISELMGTLIGWCVLGGEV